jgi:hypothetical protein
MPQWTLKMWTVPVSWHTSLLVHNYSFNHNLRNNKTGLQIHSPVPLCPPQTPHVPPGNEPRQPCWEASDQQPELRNGQYDNKGHLTTRNMFTFTVLLFRIKHLHPVPNQHVFLKKFIWGETGLAGHKLPQKVIQCSGKVMKKLFLTKKPAMLVKTSLLKKHFKPNVNSWDLRHLEAGCFSYYT